MLLPLKSPYGERSIKYVLYCIEYETSTLIPVHKNIYAVGAFAPAKLYNVSEANDLDLRPCTSGCIDFPLRYCRRNTNSMRQYALINLPLPH